MSDNITQIQLELKSLGYRTSLLDSLRGKVVAIPYKVEVGSHKGEQFTLGVSMHGNESYPEYPPHWIHLTPPFDDGRRGAIDKYQDNEGREWIAMSRPPGQLWDELPTKHMYAYLQEHLRRFWNGI